MLTCRIRKTISKTRRKTSSLGLSGYWLEAGTFEGVAHCSWEVSLLLIFREAGKSGLEEKPNY
jgi:hypothetical protein